MDEWDTIRPGDVIQIRVKPMSNPSHPWRIGPGDVTGATSVSKSGGQPSSPFRTFCENYVIARASSFTKENAREEGWQAIQDAETAYAMINRKVELIAEAEAKAREAAHALAAQQDHAHRAKLAAALQRLKASGVDDTILHQWYRMAAQNPASVMADQIDAYIKHEEQRAITEAAAKAALVKAAQTLMAPPAIPPSKQRKGLFSWHAASADE